MRLIDTRTLRVKEYFNSKRPKYAILSHTWRGEEEVSLQEWMKWEEGDPNQKAQIEAKSGFKKITSACRLALQDGHRYIWIDTNCIDKKSSAELSEAINSMFSWYRASEICYAYLEDFTAETSTQYLSRCRWFTRGWTLQELLAPEHLEFFDATWESCGTKFSLCGKIRDITGIETDILREPTGISFTCAAKKMSWASSRKTTRVEDMAYCLLGLFDINMPLLYGEGIHAFRRLQEEIIKVSTDQSIFAWSYPRKERFVKHSVAALATSPLAFGTCHHIEKDLSRAMAIQPRQREFAMTNFGLNISLPLLVETQGVYYGALDCTRRDMGDSLVGIPLFRQPQTEAFCRVHSRGTIMIPRRFVPKEPTSISIPRYDEYLHGQRLDIGSLDESVSFLLFPSNETLEAWEISTSWGCKRPSQRIHVGRRDIPREIQANTITARNRNSNVQFLFVILFDPRLEWGHVCVQDHDGHLEDPVKDEILESILSDAPSTQTTVAASCDRLALEVEVGHSVRSRSEEKQLLLFLSPEIKNDQSGSRMTRNRRPTEYPSAYDALFRLR